MKSFNYYVQVFFLGIVVLILIASIFEVRYLFLILYLQIVVGIYQFLFGAFLAFRKDSGGLFKKYFYLALASLASLSIFTVIDIESYLWLFGILFAGFPWALAVCFGVLSHRYYKES